jgi:hypothetical protein
MVFMGCQPGLTQHRWRGFAARQRPNAFARPDVAPNDALRPATVPLPVTALEKRILAVVALLIVLGLIGLAVL